MHKYFENVRSAALVLAVAVAAMLPSEGALAQVVTGLPAYVNPGTTTDLGNGPTEIKIINGNAQFSTSQGTGTGSTSGSSNIVTLDATPTVAPCVGCQFNVVGLSTSLVIVTQFDAPTRRVAISSALTIGATTLLAWGGACPATPGAVIPLQASVGGDFPFYTAARVCAYSPNGPGAAVIQFPIGAH